MFYRDRRQCFRCKRTLKSYETHHLKRREFQGSNHPRNLITLCEKCHKISLSTLNDKIMQREMERVKNDGFWEKVIGTQEQKA